MIICTYEQGFVISSWLTVNLIDVSDKWLSPRNLWVSLHIYFIVGFCNRKRNTHTSPFCTALWSGFSLNSRTFCFKNLLRAIICFGGGTTIAWKLRGSMMTSLHDRVTYKTLLKTAASTVYFEQLYLFDQVYARLLRYGTLIMQTFPNFQAFNNEEVVNKFKFACDKFFSGIPGLTRRYLITAPSLNIARLKECTRFRSASFASFAGR